MPLQVDLTGIVVGRLTVVSRAETRKFRSGRNSYYWNCRCECGRDVVVGHPKLLRNETRSCGCLCGDAARVRAAKSPYHTKNPAYGCWKAMRERCIKEDHHAFARYGGRGVKVCARWQSFERFLEDMGPRPSGKHSIERIDNDGDYCPENCRWATYAEQARNRMTNRIIEHGGESLTLAEWSEKLGIGRTTITERIKRGWSIARALGFANEG